jgi:D-alanyl-D-alanine endopeptidase (penicillin-binding protein 7)
VIRTRLFRNLRLICFAAVVLAGSFPAVTEVAAQSASSRQRVTHMVRRGETLTSIARRYGTTVSALRQANGMRGSAIQAGRRLVVYTRAPRVAAATARETQPQFKLDESGALVPDIRAEAAIVYNPENGEVLWESNSQSQRSIASITKVMTALVVLEDGLDLDERVVVDRSDVRNASTTYLRAGESVTKEDLLHLLLIASDNAAARTLARTSPHGSQGFVERMNGKAQELGLTNTQYSEPSGLLATNVSSAYDMAKLITYVSGNEHIASVMQKQTYTATAGRRKISIRSTNQLVREGEVDVQAGKTGFIRKAGYCLVTLLRLPQNGHQVAVVILGAQSNVGRFSATKHLFNWLSAKAGDLFGGTPVEASN